MSRHPVTIPVHATVGTVSLRLFPYEEVEVESGTHMRERVIDERPWAWGAMCRITFHFGGLVTTKRIAARHAYWGPSAFRPTEQRPSDAALAEGRRAVLQNLVGRICQHGIDVDVADLNVEMANEAAR